MKLTKSLFLAFAGLGLFACSNEEIADNGGKIEGPADVVVKLDLPGYVNGGSRALETNFTSNKTVNPSYVVVTVEGKNGATVDKEYTGGNITIQGVEDPTKITVEINTKKKVGEEWVAVPYATFAQLNDITVAGTRMIGTVEGAANFQKDAEGTKYTVTVPVHHTMARLEFGGIKHDAHGEGTSCRFKAGKLAGVFLNHVQLSSTPSTLKDYQETEIGGKDFFSGEGSTGWWDAIAGDNFFPNASAVYPNTGECYAYNIYPAAGAESLPVLTLYFTNLEEQSNATSHFVGPNGFALVKTYKVSKDAFESNPDLKTALCGETPKVLDGGQNYQVINFPAGYIYQIKSLNVPDEAVHPDPTGEGVNLEATISVDEWQIVAGSVDWK